MSAAGWIIGIGVGGIAAYALYEALKPKTPCDTACTGLGDPGGHATCVAACELAGGIIGGVESVAGHLDPFTDSVDAFSHQRDADDATNAKLNGAVTIPNYQGGGPKNVGNNSLTVMTSAAIQYANGCTPYFGGPGWYKCAPGTLDMYRSGVAARTTDFDLNFDEGSLVTEPVFATVADRLAWEANVGGCTGVTEAGSNPCVGPLVKTAFLTGQEGDPTTVGPWAGGLFLDQAGKVPSPTADQYWLIRGLPVKCAAGYAPNSVLLQKYGGNMAANPSEAALCLPLPTTETGTKGNILNQSATTLATNPQGSGAAINTSSALSATIDFAALK